MSRFEEYVKVTMRDSYVWELISNASYVMISGEALGVVDPDVSQLVLDGEFKYCPNVVMGTATCSVETVSCRSSRHALTLKRR